MDISVIITCVATSLLAILTAVYVILTYQTVRATKNIREPVINIDFELPTGSLKLNVENTGLTAAKNIKFHIKNDISWLHISNEKYGLKNVPIIQKGISYLKPGRSLKFYTGNLSEDKNNPDGDILDLVIEYENLNGNKLSNNILIDMSVYREVLFESFKETI